MGGEEGGGMERGKEAEEGGEGIKYFMMTWCRKKKEKKKKNEIDGSGECVCVEGMGD